MPKILFLACYFPPFQASGSIRALNIAKHLNSLGWEVTVVTPHSSVWRSHSLNLKDNDDGIEGQGIQRIQTGHNWACLSPDDLLSWNGGIGWIMGGFCRRIARKWEIDKGIGWVKPAEKACSGLKTNDVDIILATGSPFSSFRLAKRLADKLNCPYILDYRDAWHKWSENHDSENSFGFQEERKLLQGASAVTVVSPSLINPPFGHEKFHVIPNGFDPEEMGKIKPFEFDHFAIVYAGIFYPPNRVITPLMRALHYLKKNTEGRKPNWRFHYYGPQGEHVKGEGGLQTCCCHSIKNLPGTAYKRAFLLSQIDKPFKNF